MTKATVLAEGLYFGEGPRWHQGRLWFSDFYDHQVKSMDAAGATRTELEIDDQPSGLGWLPDGRLLVVAMHRGSCCESIPMASKVHADLAGVAGTTPTTWWWIGRGAPTWATSASGSTRRSRLGAWRVCSRITPRHGWRVSTPTAACTWPQPTCISRTAP